MHSVDLELWTRKVLRGWFYALYINVHSFIHSFVHSLIHSFIHSFILGHQPPCKVFTPPM